MKTKFTSLKERYHEQEPAETVKCRNRFSKALDSKSLDIYYKTVIPTSILKEIRKM